MPLVLALLACTDPAPPVRQGPAPSTAPAPVPVPVPPSDPTIPTVGEPTGDTGTASTGTTGPTGATGPTADTALPPFDCSTVPDLPGPEVMLTAPRGYNDVVFDLDGLMVGSNETALIEASDATTSTVRVPGIGRGYKLDLLPDGDIVFALSASEGGGILRVDDQGGQTLLGSGLLTHGIAVGPDGQVYAATNYTAGAASIFRVPVDGSTPELLVDASMAEPRDIAFARDFSRLYWGTLNGGGIWAVDVDAAMNVVGVPQQVAQVPQGWHDTVEVDACGNLYVGSVFQSGIFRVKTDGTVQLLLDWSFNDYGHGLEWGAGRGGWDPFSLYISHPYVGSKVSEVPVGVPGARWPGEVIGGAVL